MRFSLLEPQARRHLLQLAQAYCAATGMTMARVGRLAHGDPPFFEQLAKDEKTYQRVGRRLNNKGSFTFRVYDKIILWFDAHWSDCPEGTPFPKLDDISYTSKGNHDGQAQRQPKQTERPSHRSEKAAQKQNDQGAGDSSRILARLRRNVGDGQ